MTNVVLIGLKGHQGVCLEALRHRADVRLAAVWDDDPKQLEQMRKSPVARADTLFTPSVDEVLALKDVQVAVCCEDNAARAANLVACAQRGWHIVAEKPLALNLADLDRVRQAVTAAKVRLSMLLTMRFEGIYQELRRQVAAGAVGRPLLLSAQKSYRRGERPAWQRDYRTYGGTIPFIGIHALDMLRWVSGCRYTRVTARHHNSGLPGAGAMEETATLLLETAEHQLVDVRLDYLRPSKAPTHGDDRFRVAGSEGVIEAIGGKLTLLTHGAEPRELKPAPEVSLFGTFLDELAGQGTHLVTAEECYQMTDICLRAREAAGRGEWVSLPA